MLGIGFVVAGFLSFFVYLFLHPYPIRISSGIGILVDTNKEINLFHDGEHGIGSMFREKDELIKAYYKDIKYSQGSEEDSLHARLFLSKEPTFDQFIYIYIKGYDFGYEARIPFKDEGDVSIFVNGESLDFNANDEKIIFPVKEGVESYDISILYDSDIVMQRNIEFVYE